MIQNLCRSRRADLDFGTVSAKIHLMKYADVIAEAWEVVTSTKKLTWFAFVPAFAAIIAFMGELIWQYSLFAEEFGRQEHGEFYHEVGEVLRAITESGMLGWVITGVGLLLIVVFALPSWVQSTLILSVRQRFRNPEGRFSVRQKIIDGADYFFRLVEYHAALSPFELLSIAFYALTFYRYFHGDLFSKILWPAILVYMIIAILIGVFTVFAPYYVVHEDASFRKAISRSIGLVFLHFWQTLGLFLLMLLVNVRVIINAVLVIGIPMGLVALGAHFAGSQWQWLMVSGAVLFGLILLALASYLTALLEVFAVAYWEKAFVIMREDQEKLKQEDPAEAPNVDEVVEQQIATAEQIAQSGQPGETVKVVHVVHHVVQDPSGQPRQAPPPGASTSPFTDIPNGSVTEIYETPSVTPMPPSQPDPENPASADPFPQPGGDPFRHE